VFERGGANRDHLFSSVCLAARLQRILRHLQRVHATQGPFLHSPGTLALAQRSQTDVRGSGLRASYSRGGLLSWCPVAHFIVPFVLSTPSLCHGHHQRPRRTLPPRRLTLSVEDTTNVNWASDTAVAFSIAGTAVRSISSIPIAVPCVGDGSQSSLTGGGVISADSSSSWKVR
jgi:hypothetical protein